MDHARMIFAAVALAACGGSGAGVDAGPGVLGDSGVEPPAPSCAAAPGGGSATLGALELTATLYDRWHEAWLASPAVADLDEDGTPEIVVPRHGLVLVWHLDGTEIWRADVGGRVWASPVVADLDPGRPGLEVAVASRGQIHVFDRAGASLPGFPFSWQDELRALAAADIDGDGALELVAVSTSPLSGNGQRDIVIAVELDGSAVTGFPANTTGVSGCDDNCFVTGGYDQTLALGDLDGDRIADILAPQDNAYISVHDGTGRAFDAADIFQDRTKVMGIRMLHEYALAQQGWAPDEQAANQAHFTNTAPAIADIDGDGVAEMILLASVQNAAQNDRERGVAVWVLERDGTRTAGWEEPLLFGDYLAGLWDFDGTNVVAATNQISVATLDPNRPAPQLVFAGFDGRIHAVDAAAGIMWAHTYTSDPRVLTGGVAIADLTGDGVPEVVFTTYSPDQNKGALVVLAANGTLLDTIPLPGRGAMPVPTIADADADGQLEILVSLKDGDDRVQQVLVYTVPGSSPNCLPWPTGRGNLRRDAYLPPAR
ncbi:MAG TPA: FG-GAP-like repeat-containing protein [Kofleriaceae bacterium]|nr:FG-GAP-like repeat-containing protein [Kofleriaceae bacterium]